MDSPEVIVPIPYWHNIETKPLPLKKNKPTISGIQLPKTSIIDKWLFIATLVSGEIPYKFIDFKVDKFLAINGQEIVRLGLGIETNDRIVGILSHRRLYRFWHQRPPLEMGLE